MPRIREVPFLPKPSENLRPAVSYLRFGCNACQHACTFEIDGWDVVSMNDYGDPKGMGIVPSLYTAGLPHAVVSETEQEHFGDFECKETECSKQELINVFVEALTALDPKS